VSFVIRRPGGRYLHHNFVVSLLNDLFGIQSRGGCSCAGPYGHRLLGIDIERSHEFEREIALGCEGIKPGWVRVSFNYFISEAVFDFIVRAVLFVATHGARFLTGFVEDFIRDEVLPRYANTHTESSGTGLQTTRLREDARRIIRDAVGGGGDTLVIFCGSGSTGAVDKIVRILGLRVPEQLDDRYHFSAGVPSCCGDGAGRCRRVADPVIHTRRGFLRRRRAS